MRPLRSWKGPLLFLSLAAALVSAGTRVPAGAAEASPRPVVLTFPGIEWGLTVVPSPMKVEGMQLREDGKGAMLAASSQASGLMMTIYMERESHARDSKACRDHYWAALKERPPEEKEVKREDRANMALVEYVLEEPPLHQKNLNAYLARDGVCIDIHVSKVMDGPGDRAVFDEILKTVGFRDLDSLDHLGLASYFYLKKDYRSAIAEYRKSLDLEARNPRMEKNEWRVTVDNLGMAYGVSGDLAHAKETFVQGLSKDPQYPMFYYNLACTFGEMNDLDNAIVNLEKALQYKDNMIPGEKLPDPGKDSSFERFLSSPRFQKTVRLFPRAGS